MAMIISVAWLAAALYVLVRGSDIFVEGAKQIGAHFKLSKFAIGVFIVGFGTSLPELASSIAGVIDGAPELVLANVVGSNITNILLIVGIIAAIRAIKISRNMIQTELPIFAIATIHFIVSIYDGVLDRVEALLLLATFGAYIWYLFVESKEELVDEDTAVTPISLKRPIILTIVGIAAVLVGAYYTVEMAIIIATDLAIPIGLISIAAIAIGTSLPELFVSLQAARSGESELAIGNIFGSNSFNILVVAGLSGLFANLPVDEVVMTLGLPVLIAASVILFVIGLARQIMRWEGVMLLIFFGFFMTKLAAFM